MTPLNSTLVNQYNSLSGMCIILAINHHELIHTFIWRKTDRRPFSPRRVSSGHKEDHWVVKPSNHIKKSNAKQRQWPPMYHCSHSKTNTVLWKCFIVVFSKPENQNYKTKTPRKTFQRVIITNQHGNQEFPAGSKEAYTFYRLI